ncbi:cupin domain-containing protein [Labrys wisconsinensis]|uniref:Mannose-6-phosphate isomerase-like protein (Cupin superfamily) n=1 Tax=Labrys wisconsinensis TaxID=425677 RepID=A0ABU0J821_9HYPH|nr:cupin domain-containing protein [Labrys wisconsinensis]MDQ0470424.1 mannose-6-phosphate isomerase-like protein (cupin superfamily) [Labrys wisconsinensis]
MKDWILPLRHFRDELGRDGKPFFVGMAHGSMTVELYKPVGRDPQQPHEQDELYFVVAGTGTFFKNGERRPFAPGDVIFVEAWAEHRFEDFSEGFETWVVFWGPKGGEAGLPAAG